jgi:large subunit ribosomal protein L32
MAVQQNKKSRSKSAMRRSHLKIKTPELIRDKNTGQVSLRHHVASDGTYKGKQYIVQAAINTEQTPEEA